MTITPTVLLLLLLWAAFYLHKAAEFEKAKDEVNDKRVKAYDTANAACLLSALVITLIGVSVYMRKQLKEHPVNNGLLPWFWRFVVL